MNTLSYGFKQPEDDDPGSIFWDALSDNIVQLNSHDHDGVDSAVIASENVTAKTDTILSAAWVSMGASSPIGQYRQLVTMPAGMTYDSAIPMFKDSSGDVYHLTVEKAGTSTYYVYITDNSLTLTVYYLK